MVAKKPTSKRLSTRHRAKIAKKAREHHRKIRKDAKGAGHQKRRARKDPGIPALFPMKDQFMQKLQEERAKEIAQKAARKAAAASTISYIDDENDDNSGEDDAMMTEEDRLRSLMPQSEEAEAECPEALETDGPIDSSRRAFYREFRQVFDAADVILEVLDARDPAGCRVREIEEAILATGGNKRLILVLNKTDLVPREIVQGWLKVLQRDFPAIAFKASTQEARSNLTDSFGADGLVQLLKNYARSGDKKMKVRVGVVGYPNVGKSSLINSLKRSRVCRVGASPGVTTSRQEIHLDATVTLIDCPGIVFARTEEGSSSSLLLRNCLKVEQLQDPITPALEAISRVKFTNLQELYSLPSIANMESDPLQNAQTILSILARRLGKLRKGGVADLTAAARHLLNDWNAGKIPFWTAPPSERPHLLTGAEVVNEFAPRFDYTGEGSPALMETERTSNVAAASAVIPTPKPSSPEQDRDDRISSTTQSRDDSEEEDLKDLQFDPEDDVNLQVNQQLARNRKLAQKKAARTARRGMEL